MPHVWILLALGAGTLQTVRNTFANSLARQISPALNSWSRFSFNLPFSTLLVAGLIAAHGRPRYSLAFFLYCLGTGVTQLVGNVALVAYVKAVGQIETVLSVGIGHYGLREANLRRQLPGIALILAGIVLVLVG